MYSNNDLSAYMIGSGKKWMADDERTELVQFLLVKNIDLKK